MALWIVGLGLNEEQLTYGAARLLSGGASVILRTGRCGAAAWLDRQNIDYQTLDDIYDRCEDFDELAEALANRVLQLAGEMDAIYAVPDLRDESVARLIKLRPEAVTIPGVPVEGALGARALEPCACFAASDIFDVRPDAAMGALVREIDSRTLASEVKLRLMERYPEEHPVFVLSPDGAIRKISLEDLDRQAEYDHRFCAYLPAERDLTKLERFGCEDLNRVCAILRGPDGCPWDKKQTHMSLRTFMIEEAWEACDAIDREDQDALCEELGDLLLQISLHASIASQHGQFTSDDVATGICRKMIDRHPHVFGRESVDNAEQVTDLWEILKREEKHQKSDAEALLGVAKGLPALMRAQKVLGKADKAGKGLEAAGELPKDELELGMELLDMSERARKAGLNAEIALKRAIDAFIRDFSGDNPM